MVVQTTGYVNFSKFFEWVLFNFSMLFRISIFHFSEHYLCFRCGESVGSSNGMMMRYVNVVRCLSHSKGKGSSNLRLSLQTARREKFLVVVVALLVVIFAVLCLLR